MKKISDQPLPGNSKMVFKGVIFEVHQWQQSMFDGSTATFEKLKRPNTVNVIPVTEDGKIIILEQEQPGKDKFFSVAGGRVDPGEDEEQAAKRELLEETGYECKNLVLWDVMQPISKIEWYVYNFVAKGCKKVSEMHLDPGEKIKMEIVDFERFLEVASDDNFYDKELTLLVLRARLDPNKMKELKELVLD